MNEDLSLKKLCLFLAVAFFILLSISIVIQLCIDLNRCWSIIINIIIWMSAGISASSLTIWFTKIFDYKAKREDLLIEFFYIAFDLMSVVNGITPLTKECDLDKFKKRYFKYEENRHLWNDLTHIRNKLKINLKDPMRKYVDNIMNFFFNIIPSINWNLVICEKNLVDVDDYIRQICSGEVKIFNIVECTMNGIPTIEYRSKADSKIVDDMEKLEFYLFNNESIKDGLRFYPSIARKYTYIDDFGINLNYREEEKEYKTSNVSRKKRKKKKNIKDDL